MNYKQLSDNWFLQSSEKVSVFGEKISTTNFSNEGWYPVSIPGTVVAGLVENKVYKDPYFGLNMKDIPGYKHGKTLHFSFHYMPDDSPFRKSWWYRNEFTLSDLDEGKRVWIQFKGINYRADIWLNGKRIAATDYIIGSFRRYTIDVTSFIRFNKKNVLALEVFPTQPDDLSITFIDWGPVPPDDSMGIWQPIELYTTGPVAIKHPFVKSLLDVKTFNKAELTISAELVNTGSEAVAGILEGCIEERTFRKEVHLKSFETREVTVTPEDFKQLTIENPRVWWPYQLGTPELYSMALHFSIEGKISDTTEVTFGIRDIQSRINEHGARQFTINGKDILIRGSAWTCDLMLRQSEERDRIDVAMLKNMNLNAFRLEGKLASEYFWDLCDREGILVLAGWPCCTLWEKWDMWKPGDKVVARESLRSQIKRLRNHPCFLVWFYGSDFPPPEPVERIYLDVLEETYPELPAISSASEAPSTLKGETGVKMSGPYSYIPPVFWYTETMPGRAESFNTETGPDVCIPVMESLRKMLPEDELYPGSPSWNHHAGLACFPDTDIVNDAVRKRYGEPPDTEDFVKTAQVLSYESWRAMYEAYGRNFPKGTGVIAWMHNSAWPSMIWQLYDFFLQPTGGFYGAQKACEPLHLQYSYDDASIWVVNARMEIYGDLEAHAAVYTMNMEKKFEKGVTVSLGSNDRQSLFSIPAIDTLTPVYFLFCSLKNKGTIVSRNCYWFPTTKDIFTDTVKQHYYWPLKQHADMSTLRSMPKAEVTTSFDIREAADKFSIEVSIVNTSDAIAFFLKAAVINKKNGESIVPVYWSDNCITLLPSEQVTIIGTLPKTAAVKDIDVVVEKWN